MKYLPQSKLAKWRKDNEPKECPLLGYKTDNWVVDHDHTSGLVRGVVSSEGNALLGRIENAFKRLSRVAKATTLPRILRNMASYLEREDTGTLHPQGFRQLWKRFNSFNKEIQLDILKKLGVNRQQISECTNSKDRTNLYKKLIKQ